ncbi:hypothetical protein [Sorangium sp. So ce131]|uniref:hypothetical protein n=1 Tax=Sorangium sp. So ce131 TaxID=3133282 RepID=UPI003F5F3607
MTLRSLVHSLSLCAVAALSTFVVTSSADADAAIKRVSAFSCYTEGGVDFDGYSRGLGNMTGGLNWGYRDLYCPMDNDDRLPHETITHLNVHGTDGHSNDEVSVAACVSWYSWVGGACGATKSTSHPQVGNFALHLSSASELGALRTNGGDFAYLHVTLPGQGNYVPTNGVSSLTGFYMDNQP